ncbi:MAG: chemotaxis protein CheR [Proteobacteria bacterium]|nr:chemotaxis protein CheR [Pseudomonadota bacterium]MBU1610772.1 chemotaxis protein CheR [Pseudomonadota bacterium]
MEAPSSLVLMAKAMTEREFSKLSELVTAELGIKLPPSKKTMLQARLQKRLRVLGLTSYGDYCEYLFNAEGLQAERPFLYDVVTTNTTHFFREPKHFEILTAKVLPRLSVLGRRLRFWSAGCSTGEEPYTLSMVLMEHAAQHPGFDFEILATDISTRVLEHGMRAIYPMDKLSGIPKVLMSRYLLRSKDRKLAQAKMGPELRKKIQFRRLNFMEEFSLQHKRDVIFCRNVVIYFDRSTQQVLFTKFCQQLNFGGFLFIGHSESLNGMDLPLEQVAPTVYRRI